MHGPMLNKKKKWERVTVLFKLCNDKFVMSICYVGMHTYIEGNLATNDINFCMHIPSEFFMLDMHFS